MRPDPKNFSEPVCVDRRSSQVSVIPDGRETSPYAPASPCENLESATREAYVYFKHENDASGPRMAGEFLKLAGASSSSSP